MHDEIPPEAGLALAALLWAIWVTLSIIDIYRRGHTMNTTAKLTVNQVATAFGVKPRTVQRWADNGDLPCTRTLGGARRFDADLVAQKLEGR